MCLGASAISEAISFKNGSFMFRSRSGEIVQCFAESKHPILELSLPVEAEMLPVFNRQVSSRGVLSNIVLWTYSLVGDAGSTKFIIRRKLTVIIINYAFDTFTSVLTFVRLWLGQQQFRFDNRLQPVHKSRDNLRRWQTVQFIAQHRIQPERSTAVLVRWPIETQYQHNVWQVIFRGK